MLLKCKIYILNIYSDDKIDMLNNEYDGLALGYYELISVKS